MGLNDRGGEPLRRVAHCEDRRLGYHRV